MLEIYIITILAVFLTIMYAVGSRWNINIQKRVWAVLSKEIKPYCRSVAFKGFGSSGFKIACKPKAGPFAKLEISIVLLSREITLYYLVSKWRGKSDSITIKSNFKVAPHFTLEIVKMGTRLHRKLLENPKLKEVRQEEVSGFYICCSKPDAVAGLISNKSVVSRIRRLSDHLERLSITNEEPHLILSCRMDEAVIPQLLSLASLLGKFWNRQSNRVKFSS